MVKVPPALLHPVPPPCSAQVPVIEPPVSVVPFSVPVKVVLVSVSVLPPEASVNEKVPVT